MDIDTFTTYVTLGGAVIAALAGIWNLILQMRGKHDRIRVRLGALMPTIEQESMLSVVSLSDHPVRLIDWGFIEADGTFNSLVYAWETGDLREDDVVHRGRYVLDSFGHYFESGYVRRDPPLGAFAHTATQRNPTVIFDSSMPIWRRAVIRLRLLFQPGYWGW